MSEGGKKNDNGKPRISLIPKDAVWAIANGLTYGEKKYGSHNFRKGITYSRLLDATFRHLTAWEEGEDLDSESGNNHLDHAGASLAMLIFMAHNRQDMDDRWKKDTVEEKQKTIEQMREERDPGSVELYKYAERAQEEIRLMVQHNKETLFKERDLKAEHLQREIQSLEKPKTKFTPGDVVKHIHNDVEVTVEGTYYDEKGQAVLFVRDSANQVFAVDPNSYKSIYVEKSS